MRGQNRAYKDGAGCWKTIGPVARKLGKALGRVAAALGNVVTAIGVPAAVMGMWAAIGIGGGVVALLVPSIAPVTRDDLGTIVLTGVFALVAAMYCAAYHGDRQDEAERLRRENEEQATRRKRPGEKAGTQPQGSKKGWWSVLGVSQTASIDEIKRSYRAKLQKYHPDRVFGHGSEFIELADELTKGLNAAYAQAKLERRFR
jgi:hypothetical protein